MSKSMFSKYKQAQKVMKHNKIGMDREIISYLNNRNVFDLRGLKYMLNGTYDHIFNASDFKKGKVDIQSKADKFYKNKNQKEAKKSPSKKPKSKVDNYSNDNPFDKHR